MALPMIFWIAAALLLVAALIPMLRALMVDPVVVETVAADVAFYQAQEQEIARLEQSGAMSATEAKAARAEAARKLLAKAGSDEEKGDGARREGRAVLALVALAIPALTVALYLRLGHPGKPDMPYATRTDISSAEQDMARMIARLDAHLAENPDDLRGQELAFPIYMRMGRYDNAVASAQRIVALKGESAEAMSNLAEALIFAAKGEISEDARKALVRSLALDPALARSRFYMALLAEQDGDVPRAVALLKALEAEVPDGAEKRAVSEQLARLTKQAAPAGPAADALKALPEAEQREAIRGMVDGLAARLKEKGGTPDEWLRLLRALAVMGDKERATATLAEARLALAADAPGLERLAALAGELGLKEGGAP